MRRQLSSALSVLMEHSQAAHRVVVTGAAGFIGAYLAEALIDSGHQVVGIDNERSGSWSRLERDIDRVHADISELSIPDWQDLCRGASTVFHLAAEKYNTSLSTPEKVIDVNIRATDRLLRGASEAGIGRVVFASSLYAYGSLGPGPMTETDVLQPTTVYGMSKAAGEHLLRVAERDSGLSWAVARLFFIYGPGQYAEGGYKSVINTNFERMTRGLPPTIRNDGEQGLDYVYIDDAIDALLRLADPAHHGLTVNVASGRDTSINELTAMMSRIAGSPAAPLTIEPDWTEGTRRYGTTQLATYRLGWEASTPIVVGLQQVYDWLRRREGTDE